MSNDDAELTALARAVVSREAAAVAALVGTVETGVVVTARRMLAISETGRSGELTNLVERLVRRGVEVVAVTENAGSAFALAATTVVALPTTAPDADPGDMIAMASTLAVGAWGDALAVVAMALRGHTVQDVLDSHPAGGVGARVGQPGDESAPVVSP